MTEGDWQEERERLALVLGTIRERLAAVRAEFSDTREEVMHARRHFWDDISIKADILDTVVDVNQQAMALSEGERRFRQGSRTIAELERLEASPYFGRIDFAEEGAPAERIYIGVASFRDERSGDFLVYDWRAPISSIYYDHGPGRVSYAAPQGEIRGELLLKRQYVISGGEIRLMFDTGIVIGDELLRQALSRHSSVEMRSIVTTIQAEQNRIIRDETSRLLIVQGVAGSGKTSAALQRVAYLLYRNRDTLQADQMLLFSPNPLFSSYVSTVLPELGEQNMQQTTFQEYLDHRLGGELRVEDPFDQLEFVLTAGQGDGDAARLNGIRYKSSRAFVQALTSYAQLLERRGVAFRPLRFAKREIVSVEEMSRQFHSYGDGVRLATRISLLREWLFERLQAFAKQESRSDWVEEEVNFLDADEYARADSALRHREDAGSDFNQVDAEQELLGRKVVKGRLKPLRSWVQKLQFVDVRAMYADLFRDPRRIAEAAGATDLPRQWPAICKETARKLEQRVLAHEDATPYLFLMELVRGSNVNINVRHLIIDEAQDYTPFQFEVLRRLFPWSRMTVLGDPSQAVFFHDSTLADLESLRGMFGPGETEVIHLTRSYRSTWEIVEFTRALAAAGAAIEPFDRHGEKPRLIVEPDLSALQDRVAQDLISLRAQGYETIAVICKTAAESRGAYAALLQRHLPVDLITKRSTKFGQGTVVIPVYLAKGVEFDAVIVFDASDRNFPGAGERKLLYTACTRAMHSLAVYAHRAPSPLIAALDPRTYTVS